LEPLEKDDPSLFAISSGRAAGIPAFAAEGGLLAWSSVPDDERALTLRAAQVVRRLLTGAAALEKTGAISAEEVLGRSFVSPACGTEALPVEVAERCFELSFETSVWLRERLSRGGRTRQSARLVPPEAKGGAADIQ
jgi:hypothetical protein